MLYLTGVVLLALMKLTVLKVTKVIAINKLRFFNSLIYATLLDKLQIYNVNIHCNRTSFFIISAKNELDFLILK